MRKGEEDRKKEEDFSLFVLNIFDNTEKFPLYIRFPPFINDETSGKSS